MKFPLGRFRWKSQRDAKRLAILIGVALIALVAGVSVIVGIVRLPAPTVSTPTGNQPAKINLVRLDEGRQHRVLDDQAMLFDPTPLFLPTHYNSSQTDVAVITNREPGKSFELFPATYIYQEGVFAIAFPDKVALPGAPVDALSYGQTQPQFSTFERFERQSEPLPSRIAVLEIVDVKTGRTLLPMPIERPTQIGEAGTSPVAVPPNQALPAGLAGGDWRPMEFLTAVDSAGVVGDPQLVQSSGVAAIDAYFEKYLVKGLHIGQKIPAGFYILRVGP